MASREVTMSEWTDRLAEALGVTPLDEAQQASLLNASREIAHRVERRDTPLSTYLLGVAAGQRVAAGTPGAAAIREVVDAALTLLPPDDPEDAPIDG
jgi:hypothetical protein